MGPAAVREFRVGLVVLAMPVAVVIAQAAESPVGLARVPTAVVSTAVVSQGPGGGPGGGSDGGSDGSAGSTGVIPNPQQPSDSDGGGGEPAPEPRPPTPGSSTGMDGGARPAAPTTPALPPPAGRPGPDDPAPPRPGRPDVPAPAPATNGSVWTSSSGAAGADSAPSAVSGTQVLSVDLATEAALREYERTRGKDKRGSKLDFNTTRIGADVWHRLVAAEGQDPARFDAVVAELGGPDPFVTQTPILLRDAAGGFGTATLFRVVLTGGGMRMLDASGARFAGIDDYLEHNELPADWTMIYPAGLSVYGDPGRLISAPAHTVTAWQRLREVVDRVVGPALVSGSQLALGGQASGSDGAPVIGRYQPGRDIGVSDGS